ncbi:hypothetical protein Psi01_24240 [Planobispora siamensis]|uniref:Uncharacterized protein n=1 Tax=Planobispora siamensis TaxID=936338 RepID=A0A8J3SGU2_9ACTN|nr:hypothetical protein Psi01_24240 [Planobispora siamensis]
MIERADQLVLEYVSRAADAAHGVLRPDQRIDFVNRLRARINAERGDSESPAVTAKVLAVFGDPVVLVEREVRRLEGEAARSGTAPATGRSAASSPVVPAEPVVRPVTGSVPSAPGSATSASGPVASASGSITGPVTSAPGHAEPVVRPVADTAASQGSDGFTDPDAAAEAVTRELPPVRVPPAGAGSASSGTARPPGSASSGTARPPGSASSGAGPSAPPVLPGAPRSPRALPGGSGSSRPVPPGVARSTEEARKTLAGERSGTRSGRRRRRGARVPGGVAATLGEQDLPGGWKPQPGRAPAGGENQWGPQRFGGVRGGWDASGLSAHPRELAGMTMLLLAGLLVLADLLLGLSFEPVVIFQVPFIVWAAGAMIVLSCSGWEVGDKVLGAAAPVLAYSIGGVVAALIRTGGDFGKMVDDFFAVSGPVFVFGTAAGVFWLLRRLIRPPALFSGGVR